MKRQPNFQYKFQISVFHINGNWIDHSISSSSKNKNNNKNSSHRSNEKYNSWLVVQMKRCLSKTTHSISSYSTYTMMVCDAPRMCNWKIIGIKTLASLIIENEGRNFLIIIFAICFIYFPFSISHYYDHEACFWSLCSFYTRTNKDKLLLWVLYTCFSTGRFFFRCFFYALVTNIFV